MPYLDVPYSSCPLWQVERPVSQGGAVVGPAHWDSYLYQQMRLSSGIPLGLIHMKWAQPLMCVGFSQWSM